MDPNLGETGKEKWIKYVQNHGLSACTNSIDTTKTPHKPSYRGRVILGF